MKNGIIITFEGPDGAGKTTVLEKVLPVLQEKLKQSRLFQFFFDIDFMFEWSPPCHFRFGSSVLPDCRMSRSEEHTSELQSH